MARPAILLLYIFGITSHQAEYVLNSFRNINMRMSANILTEITLCYTIYNYSLVRQLNIYTKLPRTNYNEL